MKTPTKLRVLYAEDNQDACEIVRILLGFEDIDVIAAKTVAEAWRLAQTENFDLYLLDSQFPDGNGLDLCRQLREYSSETPILFYSGNAYKTDKQDGLDAGASEYLVKPYVGDLVEKILLAIKDSQKSSVEIFINPFTTGEKITDVQIIEKDF